MQWLEVAVIAVLVGCVVLGGIAAAIISNNGLDNG